jgi:acetolactate synthase-1/2/3 large subunit
MHNPCFKKLAEAMGARGLIARTDAELEVALEEFVSYNDGPIVLDASVCKKEHVYVISHTCSLIHLLYLRCPPLPLQLVRGVAGLSKRTPPGV